MFARSRVFLSAVTGALFLAACSGPSVRNKKAVNAFLAAGDYAGAQAHLERVKLIEYGPKNAVLYDLDTGLVLHHAGEFAKSDRSFDAAERRMDELYTKSATKAMGTLVLNDNTVDYAGQAYERVLMNVFRALNWVFLGKLDEALVESRKLERFLQELRDRFGARDVYSDDGFARYLDSLLYMDAGRGDDARISFEAARAAFGEGVLRYGTPLPGLLPPQGAAGQSELVFIHSNGVAPRKIVNTFQVAWNEVVPIIRASQDSEAHDARVINALDAGLLGHAVTVAFPDYVQEPYSISASQVFIDGRSAGATQLMEDVSAIAQKTLRDQMALVKTRAIARAAIKYILAETASRAAAKECAKNMSGWALTLCKFGSSALVHGTAAATETADTRSWSSLPAQIRVARLALAPGKHSISIYFKNAAGAVVQTKEFPDLLFAPGRRTYLAFRTAL